MSGVGLFGLGLVGAAVARRLIAAGHGVTGHDPDAGRMAELRAMGGVPAGPGEVWERPLVISAVFDTGQLAGIVDAAPEGERVLVSMSTCDPDAIAGLGGIAAAKGITLVEAPISGTSRELEEGSALLLLAGDGDGLKAFEAVAGAISNKRRRVGELGAGNRMKLAINLVLGLNRAACAEGLVFAEAMGIAPGVFLEVARMSAAESAVMATKGPKMAARDFAPEGRVAQSRKDFQLIRETAARQGRGLPFAERYLEAMADLAERGEGDLDNAAILLAIERMAKGQG
ncbi:NAD(P)-dependent oxidoreductase [Histidinibacterium lentulum]|uniref:NAD(P)-dependent oxidoreductase n=1 Tax=Histidinibacterium lentulum TaxID=2480588 RepID=A0A3N2QRJ3_9RHOB|nr:NAD(P)-dependent oxidoreductase [Histidinibacterium lentulum]ROT97799.1 NAD(P)-dependent oxidoreductase [Histidinibacterium lentulum]